MRILGSEKSRLEVNVEGLTQRLKALDESEQRYKDENWNLETQTHELIASAKETASREQRLQQALTVVTAEKNAAQRDLDDIKQAHGKLTDDYHAFRRAHDSEASVLRKNISGTEADRDVLQRRVDELTSQNQELARAMAGNFRDEPEASLKGEGSEPADFSLDQSDTDPSPPPSPSKGASRNSMLESETLKTSLHHAHRMIQNLKSSIHREKTEKLELRRMLHESRDELENRRSEAGGGAAGKRIRSKAQVDSSKRTQKPHQLGAGRQNRVEVEMESPDWEDQIGERNSGVSNSAGRALIAPSRTDANDSYHTATEAEDSFETANERETGTETEAFQTGNESLGGDSSGEVTETEGVANRRDNVRDWKPSPLTSTKRSSFISTASTSDDERTGEVKGPVQHQMKYRVKLSKGSRRSRIGNEGQGRSPASTNDSPASYMSGRDLKGHSLFAELGDLEGQSDDDSDANLPKTEETHDDRTAANGIPQVSTKAAPMVNAGSTAALRERSRLESPATTNGSPHGIVKSSLGGEQIVNNTSQPPATSNQARLTFSKIYSIETAPTQPSHESFATQPTRPSTAIFDERDSTPGKSREVRDSTPTGVLNSVLGWAIGKKRPEADDDKQDRTEQILPTTDSSGGHLAAGGYPLHAPSEDRATTSKVDDSSKVEKFDHGSQTVLSAQQIEELMAGKNAGVHGSNSLSIAPSIQKLDLPSPTKPATQNGLNPGKDGGSLSRSVKRLNSATSFRPPDTDVPPLPADHRQAIAAAQQAPTKDKSDPKFEGIMGPPTQPASAYRSAAKQPQTLNDQVSHAQASAAPRARYSTTRSTRSRRSSVSSFESELDARFNIRADGLPIAQGIDNSTDPRMIQAITETMIGEYLWKYTRKAGRGEMSDKRHRRFFWVHPYTRTLYWSDQDPSTAGRAQLKAKSVAIEAVRVVVDDNPMPPGLHRKSLIVITPGRDIKFTASTGQRHETWFNALSYLLLRSNETSQSADPNQITAEDVAEFNPGFGRSAGSRVSLSSYNSRTNTTRRSIISNRAPSPSKSSIRRMPPTPHATSSSRLSQNNHASIGSRLSSYWRPRRDSSTSRAGVSASTGSVYNASVVNDSAEDIRQVLERKEQESDQLENVRACCDGMLPSYSLIEYKLTLLGKANMMWGPSTDALAPSGE